MKISIIVPIYNMERYLKECLESIMLQTLKDIEIICVNDGSYDRSQEILNEYAWKDKRIKIINQTNAGVSSARNVGIRNATGEYLYFLDPDDYFPDEETLSDMYDAAIKHKALICGGGFREDFCDRRNSEWHGNLCKYTFSDDEMISYKDYQYDYGFTRFIYKRAFIIDNNLFFPKRIFFEDPVFFVKAMTAAKEFYGLTRCTYCYRTGYKTINWSSEQVADLLRGMKDNIALAKEKGYWDLIALERARLENDYLEAILKFLCSNSNNTILLLLNDINELLFPDGKRIEYYIFQRKMDNMNYDRWVEKTRLEEEIRRGEEEIKRGEEEIKKIDEIFRSSTTWKIGSLFLAIPKCIKRIIKGDTK